MLAEIQAGGDDEPDAEGKNSPRQNQRGLQFWTGDLVDAVATKLFFDTFGVSVSEFLSRHRKLRDSQLREEAWSLLERKFAGIEVRQL
jgi:hypothetical protein